MILIVLFFGGNASCPRVRAQEEAAGDPVKRLETELEQRDALIQSLARRVTALENEVQALRVNEASGGSAGPAAPVAAAAAPRESVREAPNNEYEKEERLARAALDRALIARGSLLLAPGTVEVDNGFSYFNASSDRVSIDGFTIYPVLVVGDIVSERSERDVLLSSATTRIGLPHALQLDVRVPYGYQSERTVTADNKKISERFLGLGDVELALTKQIRRGRGAGPDLLAGVRWKSTTGPDPYEPTSTEASLGTGFQSVQASLTAVKPSDPMVFFGSLSYAANLSATKKIASSDPANTSGFIQGHINPGDTIGFQLGTALSVNPEASLNFALDQRFTRSTSLDGTSLPGTYLSEAVFHVGSSYVYAPGRSLDLGLGVGLSRGAPNFQLSVNFPLRFSLAGLRHK